MRLSGDGGLPVVLAAPDSPSGKALREVAEAVAAKVRILPPRAIPTSNAADLELRVIQ